MDKFDTIIIGAGPAGVSAAVYLKRFNLNPLVITTKNSSLLKANIENYYGFSQISGSDLFDNGLKQLESLGIETIFDEVTSIEPSDGFIVKTANKSFLSKTVLLATGKSRNKLNIKGFKEYLGSGISMCATCDGFFFRGKNIGIIGSGKYMETELSVLERFTKNITIFTNGEEYNSNYKVVKSKILEAEGDVRFKSLVCEDKKYELDGVFVALGEASGLDFSKHIGLRTDEDNNLVVDGAFMTNCPGIFAAGDITGGILQVSKSVADGCGAAFGIKNYLK